MSDMEYKTVLRAKIPSVGSREEHLAWMLEHVGKPEESGDGWFTYGQPEGSDPYFRECSWGSDYGFELVLMHSCEEQNDVVIDIEDLLKHVEEMRRLVGEGVPIRLVSYGWYNGVDEPICW